MSGADIALLLRRNKDLSQNTKGDGSSALLCIKLSYIIEQSFVFILVYLLSTSLLAHAVSARMHLLLLWKLQH
jgi:hypothetical protein